MAGLTTITIYGSDTDLGAMPDRTAVLALADLVTKTFDVRVVHAAPELDVKTTEFISGKVLASKEWSFSLSPETMGIAYPTNVTAMDSYYSIGALQKKFIYLWLNAYKIVPTGYSSTKCVRVYPTSFSVKHIDEAGEKEISFKFMVQQ